MLQACRIITSFGSIEHSECLCETLMHADDDEIVNAAKTVGAHDFIIKLENGYDT